MSKRTLFGGLAAVALALATGDTAQAQYRGGHYHGGHYHGGGYGGGFYRPIYAPVYSPIVVAPRPVIYSGINSPYFGFGNAGYPFGGYGGGWGYPAGGWGYGGTAINVGISRPGFGIGFNIIR